MQESEGGYVGSISLTKKQKLTLFDQNLNVLMAEQKKRKRERKREKERERESESAAADNFQRITRGS